MGKQHVNPSGFEGCCRPLPMGRQPAQATPNASPAPAGPVAPRSTSTPDPRLNVPASTAAVARRAAK